MGRLPQLDTLRGLAVLAMLTWHSADSWLQGDLREGSWWSVLRGIGGLCAPLFLALAGAGASLAARRDPAGQRVWARGLELLVMGYALRLQTWLFDTGALWNVGMLRAFAPLLAGTGLLWWAARQLALGRPARTPERRRAGAYGVWPERPGHASLAGVALAITGLAQVESVDPGRLELLLRPDVLQAIGLSLVALGLSFRLYPSAPSGVLAAAAAAWALASSAAGEWPALEALPDSLTALLVSPAGQGAPFPLFPWFTYALAGAAAARSPAAAAWQAQTPPYRQLALSMVFGVLALLYSEGQGHVYAALQAYPSLTPGARCAFHLVEIAALGCAVNALVQLPRDPTRWLRGLGRASLLVYWTHLVFVYGVMVNPLKGRLDHAQWGATLLALVWAMWMLSQVRYARPRVAAHT